MDTTFIPISAASLSAALTDSATYASVYFDAFWSVAVWILAISAAVIVCILVLRGLTELGYTILDAADTHIFNKNALENFGWSGTALNTNEKRRRDIYEREVNAIQARRYARYRAAIDPDKKARWEYQGDPADYQNVQRWEQTQQGGMGTPQNKPTYKV